MSIRNPLALIAIGALLALAGCGKSNKADVLAPIQRGAVHIDVPKLENALNSANQDAKITVSKVQFALRYQNYPEVLANLDKLAADPTLNDAQKKLVGDVTEQVKQAQAQAQAPPQ